jgi:UDP-N-acetylglucosamine:LPS N-acetylglucosamine transferase
LHVVGYTTEIDEYMAAADLLVGKPGGLASSEALARGLALVIVRPIPGQEERNADTFWRPAPPSGATTCRRSPGRSTGCWAIRHG